MVMSCYPKQVNGGYSQPFESKLFKEEDRTGIINTHSVVTNSCEKLTTSLIVHSDNNLKVGFNGREGMGGGRVTVETTY